MKKIMSFLLIILVIVGCQSTKTTQTLQINGIENINYEKLTQSINSDVKFILYIGRPDCGDCQEFYPILEDYIDTHQGTGIYYLNIKDFRDQARAEEATQQEKDFYENLYTQLKIEWTPTIHVFENGIIIKTYQYLDESYFDIKDRPKQKEKRQEFLDEFEAFMNAYYKEEK